jgi:protein phosphatase
VNSVRYSGRSEKGLRDINEDSFCAEKIGRYWVFAVADGLGGHAAGEVASSIAIDCVRDSFRTGGSDPKMLLKKAVADADARILAMSSERDEIQGMATTLTAACVDDTLHCTIINVGDSRAHLISATGFEVTKDHSYVQGLVDAGEITPEEAWHHPKANVLIQALGDPAGEILPDIYEANLTDTFLLLTSDGLHDYVKAGWIREIVLGNGIDLEKSCDELIAAALKNDSDDNITVVLAHPA